MPRRLLFIDNLRWSAIAMVVTMHAAVTYSPFGRWYYREHPPLGLAGNLAFAAYQSFQHAVSMGLLFGIAGYFAASSIARKGIGGFLRERCFRLGLPLLVYLLLIGPLTEFYVAGTWRSPSPWGFAGAWWRHVADGSILDGSGPLWFCLVLLGFSLCVALLCPAPKPVASRALPGPRAVGGYAFVMASVTFAVGIMVPRETVVLNLSIHDLPQYPFMFAAGVLAWRHQWLDRLPSRGAPIWLTVGLAGGGLLWSGTVVLGGALSGTLAPYEGGWHWQAATMDLWRSLTCLSLSLGLVTLYRDRFDRQGPVARFLTRNAFGVYVVHPPILIAVTRLLHAWPTMTGVKFAVAALVAIMASFLVVGLVVRRVPLLRSVL
jgi:hypothetical protein